MSHSGNTVKEIIIAQAEKQPDKKYIYFPLDQFSSTDTCKSLSYGELKKRCETIVQQLYSAGLKQGDIISVALPNGLASLEIFLAAQYGGLVVSFLNLVGQSQWEYILEHSRPRMIITDSTYYSEFKKIGRQLKIDLVVEQDPTVSLTFDRLSKGDQEQLPLPLLPLPRIRENDQAVLMYTSGTTGKPKGVLLSQKNTISGGRNTALAHELKEEERSLCVLPLYHINAQMVSIMSSLVSGGTVVLPPSFSVQNFWYLIASFKCTWFSVVPTQINYLIHRSDPNGLDLSSIKFGRSASAPLAPEVHRNFEKQFSINIVETMGITEAAAQILSNPRDPKRQKYGTPGHAVGNEVRVVDKSFKSLPVGQKGEIAVRGDNVMLGYLNNDQATRDTIVDGGWLLSGDLGYRDEDGFFFVTGRKKEIIIKGGENISPREIDDVLYENSEIIEAASFGVPCKIYGQKIEVAVVLKSGSNLNETTILELCETKLGHFKKPEKVYFLDQLPKGPSGKIQRGKILPLVD